MLVYCVKNQRLLKMKRIGGFRRKTRSKLSKGLRFRGKFSLSNFFRAFKDGEQVYLKAEPAVQKGMYHPRFHGKVAVVTGKLGECYELMIKDGKKDKKLMVHPIHMKKVIQ